MFRRNAVYTNPELPILSAMQKRSKSTIKSEAVDSFQGIDDAQRVLLFRLIQKALDQSYRNRDGIVIYLLNFLSNKCKM